MSKVSLGQLRDYWKAVSDWVKGVDSVSTPKVKIIGNVKVESQGRFIRLASEQKPTETDGVKEGNELIVIDDTSNERQKFIFYKGQWWEI